MPSVEDMNHHWGELIGAQADCIGEHQYTLPRYSIKSMFDIFKRNLNKNILKMHNFLNGKDYQVFGSSAPTPYWPPTTRCSVPDPLIHAMLLTPN